jgi:hypothetical protein
MIHYHGLPITPEPAAVEVCFAGHAFVSFRYPDQLRVAIDCCQSFALDNGAFSAWKSGNPVLDWHAFYEWAASCKSIPACDWAVIPDVIDGDEAANDALVSEWPLPKWFGVPVWHMHESLGRLERLASSFPRVAIGSSGEFATVGSTAWWGQMASAMRVVCDDEGRPLCKLHGLRMLNPEVFSRLPLSSADSTNIGRNIGIDKAWRGTYQPIGKPARARVMRQRIESSNSPSVWGFIFPENSLEEQLW